MTKKEIEQAAEIYSDSRLNGHDKRAFISGATFINERQQYSKDDMQKALYWMSNNHTVMERSGEQLLKLWEEKGNG